MTNKMQTTFSILAACILLGAVYMTLAWISPPAPLPADSPASEFSAERAMQDLEVIAKEPHPVGSSPAHAEVRDYLLGEIRALGLEGQVQETFAYFLDRGALWGGFVENILVRLPGTDPEGAILLLSHYDSSPGVPGAVDSGSGVVTILELLSALSAGTPLRQDVIILFSDGEEPGTLGAQAFVSQHPWLKDVRFTINMDQFWVGPPMLVRSSKDNGMLIKALARSSISNKPAYISFPFNMFPSGDTDLTPFFQNGVPGAEFNGGGPFAEKHTDLDRPKLVDPGSLQQAGNQLLALVRDLGNQSLFDVSSPDQTFFPLMGYLVHYPNNLAWQIAFASGACFMGMIAYGLRTGHLTWRGLGSGFLASLLSLVLTIVLANLIWQGLLTFHPEYAYNSTSMFRQKLSSDFLYAIGFIILSLVCTVILVVIARKKVASFDLAGGTLFTWFPLTIATLILIPATSYLFSWVLLTSSLALLFALVIQSKQYAQVISDLGFLANAIAVNFIWIPLFYFAILAGPMSPDSPMLSMMTGLAALWMGSMIPLLDKIAKPNSWPLPIVTVLVFTGFMVTGHFLVGKDSPPPLANPIGYWLDANDKSAYWVTFSDDFDKRQANLLEEPTRRSYTELHPTAPKISIWMSDAPLLDLEGPQLVVLRDEWVAGRRVVDTKITSSMYERIIITIPKDAPLLAITLPANSRIELPAIDDEGWWLRFEGIPIEGFEITMEFSVTGTIQFLLIEEKTGLPSFPGISTQPEAGTMKSPGVFTQVIPTDFTVVNQYWIIPAMSP